MIVCPEKWKKYEVLFRFGLASEDEINNQIKRYYKHHQKELFLDIAYDMERNTSMATYVIKLVPMELRPKLKNFIVTNIAQLRAALKSIESFKDYDELWWCKTELSSGSGIHGRFIINSGNTTNVSQHIEQVWADTGRKIEKIGDGVTFLSAQRLGWGRHFILQNCELNQTDPALAELQFRDSVRQLEELRTKIEQFVQAAIHLGLFSLCIEYKMIGGKLYIVDWDSPDDKALLRKML